MAIELEQHGTISAGATRNVAIDLTPPLQGAGLLTGTPTIVHVDDDDVTYAGSIPPVLTITNKAISVAAIEIMGRTVAIGKAIQCKVSGAVAGYTYRLLLTCGTATSGETMEYVYILHCE